MIKARRDFDKSIYSIKYNLTDVMVGMDIELSELFEDSTQYYKDGVYTFYFSDCACIVECDVNWEFNNDNISMIGCNIFKMYLIDEDYIKEDISDKDKNSLKENMLIN